MNERIEHLMYLAGLTAQGCWDKLDDYDRTAIEKFAELIIRECMSICDVEKADYNNLRKQAWDREEKELYSEGAACCDTIKYKMKHKFRIE